MGSIDLGDLAGVPVARLADALYATWFTRAGASAHGVPPADAGLIARLRAAHPASESFETGWIAVADKSENLYAVRSSELRSLRSLAYANLSHPAAPVMPGDRLALSALRDNVDQRNGWWIVDGLKGAASNGNRLLRIYWNAGLRIVADLIRDVATVLESDGQAYTIKCPVAAPLFRRVDAVVVYVSISTWNSTKDRLKAVHARLRSELRDEAPPLTRQLGRGVAIAEDPANGQSFGQSRSHAIAWALISLLTEHADRADDVVIRHLASGLEAWGISPARPYLSTSSPDDVQGTWAW